MDHACLITKYIQNGSSQPSIENSMCRHLLLVGLLSILSDKMNMKGLMRLSCENNRGTRLR
jgi:hypothetical protein